METIDPRNHTNKHEKFISGISWIVFDFGANLTDRQVKKMIQTLPNVSPWSVWPWTGTWTTKALVAKDATLIECEGICTLEAVSVSRVLAPPDIGTQRTRD